MCRELQRGWNLQEHIHLEVELVWDIFRQPEEVLLIRVMDTSSKSAKVLHYWSFAQFQDRLELMRDIHRSHRHHSTAQKQDPWREQLGFSGGWAFLSLYMEVSQNWELSITGLGSFGDVLIHIKSQHSPESLVLFDAPEDLAQFPLNERCLFQQTRCEMESAEGLYSEDVVPAQESDSKSRLEDSLHALNTLHLQVSRMEEVLLEVQWSISSQSGLLAEIREAQISQNATAGPASVAASAPQSSRSILKKQVRTEEQVEFIPTPPNSPQKLPILPGEVKEVKVETSTGDNKTQRSSSRRGVRGRDREGRRDVVSSSTMDGTRHIGTLDELSNIFARGLLISHSRSSNSSPPGTKSLNLTVDSEIPERSEQNSQSGQSSSQIGERSDSKKTHDAVLEKTRRLSLDLLRSNHDAQAIQDTASRTLSTDSETRGGMPCAAEIWMILAGVLRFGSGWLSRLWGLSLLLMGLATIGSLLLWFSNGHTEPCHGATIATTISYIFGVVCSTWILRSDEVQELVGAQKGNLHMYARNRGFMKEWRRKSKARFCESMGFLIIMCASRFLRYSQGMPLLHDLFPNVAFCFAASGFAAVAYLQLHILSGLELSIDSFSVNFFRTMQFQDAIEEWNVVQATLRHVSLKLSKSLLVLGSCCCGASLVHLIYLPVLRSDARTGLYLILGNQWLLPPIMFFLYTMARAASVTEKASRVSPLVNSWAFESEEPNQWMDLGRQYLVQYMMQSEAGFYMQGVRLRIFQVTKMCYYLGAILFAVGTSIFD